MMYLPIIAVPMERPRVYKGRAITPKRSREYIKACKTTIAAQYGGEKKTGAVKVELQIYKKRKVDCRLFGDVDNLAKSILDAMTGIVYCDDCQVVELVVKKHYSISAGVLIRIYDA